MNTRGRKMADRQHRLTMESLTSALDLWKGVEGWHGVPVRVRHALIRAGFDPVMTARTPDKVLMRYREIGPAAVKEIRKRIPYSPEEHYDLCPHCMGRGFVAKERGQEEEDA
jgi:hypothetical protein